MNKFLLSATQDYPENLQGRLIHPVSKADAKIFIEISKILNKVELNEVKAIWDQFKYLKDQEIYNHLCQWNLDHQTLSKDEEKDGEKKSDSFISLFKRDFIKFRDLRIDIINIRCYEKDETYNVTSGKMEYYIILNKLPLTTKQTSTTSDKTIKYYDIEERDRDFEALDSFIENYKGINFINQSNE